MIASSDDSTIAASHDSGPGGFDASGLPLGSNAGPSIWGNPDGMQIEHILVREAQNDASSLFFLRQPETGDASPVNLAKQQKGFA